MGCRVVGIEYSPYAIAHAEKGVRDAIRRGGILESGIAKTNAFEVVVCLNVLEYVAEEDVAKAIANLVRWSRDRIYFTTCFTHSRYALQKYSFDPFRTTVKTQAQWKELFTSAGAGYAGKFYDGSAGDVLIFKKRSSKNT